ncbi:SIMPL domain-containing protein [soil metagenome]
MSTFDDPSPARPLRTVTVTGIARASSPPDRATVSLGVQSRAPSAGEALALASQRAGTVIGALRDLGGEGEMRTDSLSLWREEQPDGTRYVATNTVNATVGACDVGAAIDAAATAAGDDFSLHGVSFSIADAAPLLETLRVQALADARAGADMLAAAEGCRTGDALVIVEGSGGWSPFPVGARDAAFTTSTPVEPGTETLMLAVTVTYALHPDS